MVENPSANAADVGLIPGSGRFPWRRKWQPPPVSLPGKSHGQRSLQCFGLQRVGYDLETRQQQQEFDKDLLNELNTFFGELPSR